MVGGQLRPWLSPSGPRRAGVSSFGMGGTNAHLVLEESPDPSPRIAAPARPVLLALSGRSPEAVARMASRLAEHVADRPDIALNDVAFTLGTSRRHHSFRRVLVVRGRDDALQALHTLANSPGTCSPAPDPASPEVVFLFPGQGSQTPGIARRLAWTEPAFRVTLERCYEILLSQGVDLEPLLTGTDDLAEAGRRLSDTQLAQPAVFAVSYALAKLLESWGVRPVAMLGHSVGEYVAACLAGILSLEDGLRVLVARGRMIQALPRGAMLAVSLEADQLEDRLADDATVSIAAHNAPGSTVLAGPLPAIDAWQQRLELEGVSCRRLATSHAFHSGMMNPILPDFRAIMASITLHPPHLPYVSGLTGDWLQPDTAISPDYYVQHLREPVRFSDGMATLLAAGYRRFLEVGPGTTLTRLALRHRMAGDTLPTAAFAALPCDDDAAPRTAMGGLWTEGLVLDWRNLEPQARRVPLPPYPFERIRHWIPAPTEASVPQRTAEPAIGAAIAPIQAIGARAAEIALIWQQLLGHAHVTPTSNFHALGGDSLLAVRVAAILSSRFDIQVPPHALLEAPTPDALAAWMAAASNSNLTRGERPFALVTLRSGQTDCPPLFLLHAVGGTVNFYSDLATALQGDIPVHAVQAAALDGVTPPDRRVEAAAARCLDAIRWVQPVGPYRLAGSSFGGLLAYEVTRQLGQTGDYVDMLALIDTPAMEDLPEELSDDAAVVSYVAGLLGCPLPAEPLRALGRTSMIEQLIARCGKVLPPNTTVADLDLHLRVFQANTEAMHVYRIEPCPLPERVLFFRARERDTHTPAHPERPWQSRLGRCLEVIEVSGSHLSMMRQPHVAAIAARLDRALEAPMVSAR
ncbi:MAG TPA: acyltransferase domain-containing protein [Geminicoccus sp.]|nr:acyltransferase domain-containing protein [Geminicoccus sp.]HEX2524920.1 acyltransferase domain-containing protein [Geminicoccus sp.]